MAPPPYRPDIVMGRIFRFQAASALDGVSVTDTNLLNLVLMAKTATTSARFFTSVKVRQVEIWGAMASDLVPVTASVEFTRYGYSGSKKEIHSDTSMGSTRPAYVSARPSKDSLARMWTSTTSETSTEVFNVSCPDNSIIDVHISFVIANGEPASSGPNPTGASTGKIYYCPLSGASSETLPVASAVLPGV